MRVDFDVGLVGDILTVGTALRIMMSAAGNIIATGTGDPEGSVTAVVGSMFLRTDSGTNTLYVKESGTGNTGWVGK